MTEDIAHYGVILIGSLVVSVLFLGLKRIMRRVRGIRFEDYEVQIGYTEDGHYPWAAIEEFGALVGLGDTHQEAVRDLEQRFNECIRCLREDGEPIPRPGSGKGRVPFAAADQIESLRPFIDEFWSQILGTSFLTSFVSNESTLPDWEHYVPGGREEILRRVEEEYGVDISEYYDDPIPRVLRRINGGTT